MASSSSRHDNWKVIAISGATNGGKTTLANRLVAHYAGSVVIHQDEFYIAIDDPRHVWVCLPGNHIKHQNWERAETIDWQAFEARIQNVISSGSGPAAGAASGSAEKLAAKRFLILDGHIILNHKPFRDLLDKRFFITLPRDVCRSRRSQRSYDPPDPAGYFDAVVWPEYLSHKRAMQEMHDESQICYLDGTQSPDQMLHQIVAQLSHL